MSGMKLLIANRGEIAIRIARAAAELAIPTVAVYTQDDEACLHVRKADEAHLIPGTGAAGYLDGDALIEAARRFGCSAIHPGYGFLSENSDFARKCHAAGITFVGPTPEVLDLFGNKAAARALAGRCGIPVLPGTDGPTSLDDARAFFATLPQGAGMVIKAIAGGGGRGMRIVFDATEIETAYSRCASEALSAFGNGDLYVEQLVPRARHVEVQVVADSKGNVAHLWERECTLQRRNQKLVEIAPSPSLDPVVRAKLVAAAVRLATESSYQGVGTFEFLVDEDHPGKFVFIEANPRLQVEHTVTEEVTGVDLVQAQLRIASGVTLSELGIGEPAPLPRGYAIQVRINMETMAADGSPRPAGGTLTAFEGPAGAGVRLETLGYAGYKTSARFDSLLAKLITHSNSNRFEDAVRKAARALSEFRIEGVATNRAFLQALLDHPDVRENRVYTRFIEDHAADLIARAQEGTESRFFENVPLTPTPSPASARMGARVDPRDPLAVLAHGQQAVEDSKPTPQGELDVELEGTTTVRAPLQGTVLSIDVSQGDAVRAGQQLLIMEAMKMEHVVEAPVSGIVRALYVEVGDTIAEGSAAVAIEEKDIGEAAAEETRDIDLDEIRPDLAEVQRRHALLLDEERPAAVARRRKTGQRTARENIEDLCDPGSFVEYGGLVIAAQRSRRPLEDLIENTPADGLITGIGRVNGHLFGEERSRCVVMSYDYTVFAGTQGQMNHRKHDRMFHLAEQWRLPLVFFTEGGGGRPGDGDGVSEGLRNPTFYLQAKLHGLVPQVGINSGRCFAGNAAVLGLCDVVIATKNSTIGMGGPAMVEGGGLGVFRPEEIGPADVQVRNGVIDVLVEDEAEAVQVAKKYLSYFQGRLSHWDSTDQRLLRRIIPENRLRMYDVRKVIETLADVDSVLEIRRHFGLGMVTALARIEGRPIGIVANNPAHLAGAIDSDGADKAARFMRLCDAFGIPVLSLCDTPGIMVGPEAEKTALVRHSARMFVTAASMEVPVLTVVLRKSYGLGAMAMGAGAFRVPFFVVSWPTGEFGGMGLEGAVKLGYRKELEAIQDLDERKRTFEKMVAAAYERGKALSVATNFEIDDVIDPADTRRWIVAALEAVEASDRIPFRRRKPRFIDTW